MDSIVGRLVAHAASQPEAPAYIENGRTLSYRALAEGAERAATWLHGRGVRAGDTVALAFEQSNEDSLHLFYGLAWLGAVVLPLDPGDPAAHRGRIAALYGARWVVSGDTYAAGAAERIDPAGFAAARRLPGAAPRGDAAGAAFLYQFSSGTTGTPKAVLSTHEQVAQSFANMVAALGWNAGDRLLPGRPWPEKVALRLACRMHFAGGALVNERFPATRRELFDLVRDPGVTGIASSPSALRKLLATEAPQGKQPALRFIYIGGAPATPDELRAMRSELTPGVFFAYAASEFGMIALLGPHDPVGAPGVVGRLVPGVEGHAVAQSGEPLAPGAVGRLGFRTAWLSGGYAANPQASAEHFRGGWFYPGDVGSIDARGWISLEGRADDVINFSGVKILPQEIEAVLLRHPDIADAAVLGVPSARVGQVPVAFIVPRRAGVDYEALRSFCLDQFGARRKPARFVALKRLPRNAAGKIVREELLALYETARKRQGAPQKS